MKTLSKTVLQGATVALGLLLASAGAAWAAPINVKWAGVGWNTSFDNLDVGFPANLSIAEASGSFGVKRVEVLAEFDPADVDDYAGITCEYDIPLLVGIYTTKAVLTSENHDQLIGESEVGWMCLDLVEGDYYGWVEGEYIGGTGRFAGANGHWESTFEGKNLEPTSFMNPDYVSAGYRYISGEVTGNVNMQGSGSD